MSLKRTFSKVTTFAPTRNVRARLGFARPLGFTRKRVLNRHSMKSGRIVKVPRMIKYLSDQPFPQVYNNVFHYSMPTQQIDNGGAGADLRDFVFAGNDIWDPNNTASDFSVNGWDEAKLIWGRYKVLASRITVTANWRSSTDNRPIELTVFPSDYDTPITNYETAHTAARQVHATLDSGQNSEVVKSYATSKAMFCVKDIDERAYSADYHTDDSGDSPINQWFWHVIFTNPQSLAWAVNFRVDIEFFTINTSPRTLVPPDPVEA